MNRHLALSLSALLVACGGGVPCNTTGDCSASADARGQLCVAGSCAPCTSDAQCAADPPYGPGATCSADGRCVAMCAEGGDGCACRGDGTCDTGLMCRSGTCVAMCTPCGPSGECAPGAACQDGCCLSCVRGTEDCACQVGGGCDSGLSCDTSNTCVACTDGARQCSCRSDGTCDAGLRCDAGTCVPETCTDGAVGCPCRDAAPQCDGGVCRSGACAACTNDVAGCPCQAGACSALVCDADNTCRAARTCADLTCDPQQDCVPGTPARDATCGMCRPGLAWDAGMMRCVSVPSNCDPGATGSILDACTMRNETCVEAGTAASCGDCIAGFLREGTMCRRILTCADLACGAMNRECNPATSSTDATCGACSPGFMMAGGMCVRAMEPCSTLAASCAVRNRICEEPAPGSGACTTCASGFVEDPDTSTCIPPRLCSVLDCLLRNRNCEGEPLARCASCLTGYVEDAGTCRLPLTCAEVTCGSGQTCSQPDPGMDARCMGAPVCGDPTTEIFDPYSGACVVCPRSCTGGTPADGETGRPASSTVFMGSGVPGACICETEPGHFYGLTAEAGTFPCDRDGDGWVRQTARASVESLDPVLRANARCTMHRPDAFRLQGEGGLTHVEPISPIYLYESLRNDDALELSLASATEIPSYGARRPAPEELNSLTKLCSGAAADHNHNFVSDVSEYSGIAFPTGAGTGAVPAALAALYTQYTRFSYYVELSQGAFVPDDPAAYDTPVTSGPRVIDGLYAITERDRATDAAMGGVPVEYDAAAGTYHDRCRRHRDADSVMGTSARMDGAGLDFAAFPSASSAEVVMAHHSQYRCLQLVDDMVYSMRDPARDRHYVRGGDIAQPSQWTVNVCGMTGSPAMVSSTPNPDEPRWSCSASATPPTLAIDQVFWGAVNYLHGTTPMAGEPQLASLACGAGASCPTHMTCVAGQCRGATAISCGGADDCPSSMQCTNGVCRASGYVRGCIDECMEQANLPMPSSCAGPAQPGFACCGRGSPGVACEADSTNFGAIQCGCGRNYGGTDCEIGCPSAELMTDPGYRVSPRAGYWMCGHFAASDGTTLSGGGYTLRGEVPITATDGTPMTGGGFTLTAR